MLKPKKKYRCEHKYEEDEPDFESSPKNCHYGPGWKGRLNTSIEKGKLMIDWTSLVERQHCVHWVTIIDNGTSKSKSVFGTGSDVNLPIQYGNASCHMKIIIVDVETKCYTVHLEVPCQSEGLEKREAHGGTTPNTAGVICYLLFVLSVAAIGAVVVAVVLKRRSRLGKESPRQEKHELNDLYGTYYQV